MDGDGDGGATVGAGDMDIAAGLEVFMAVDFMGDSPAGASTAAVDFTAGALLPMVAVDSAEGTVAAEAMEGADTVKL